MKRVFVLTLLLFAILGPINSQSQNNSFPTENAEWYERRTDRWTGVLGASSLTERHFVEGDTIYNDTLYSKLYFERKCEKWFYIDREEYYEDSPKLVALYRVFENKVFVRAISGDTFRHEYKLYDFNMQLGDTIYLKTSNLHPFVVDSVININGRNHFVLNPNYIELNSARIIEGAGNILGFFGHWHLWNQQFQDVYHPTCIRIRNEYVLNDCSEVCLQESKLVNADTLIWSYPNPFTNVLNVDFYKKHDGVKQIKVINLKGDLLFSAETEIFPYQIERLESLNPGVYFILVFDQNEISTSRVLKLR